MSMVINLVEDHNIYLCEGGPVYNGSAPPAPITYLTQWKIVGNSEVHTLPYPDGIVLPTGYKRCEYLEFHGTEYINSGVLLKNDIGISLDLSTTSSSKTMIGARNNAIKGVLFGYHSPSTQGEDYRMYFAYGANSTNYTVQTNVCDGLLHHIVLDSQQAKIDNESVVINRGNEFPQMLLFIGTWNNYNGTPDDRMFEGNMYSVRIYDSNGNLFNGIPCLDDNDVPCLYDTVSNTTFYNDGTGTFGYKLYPQPTEIWSCGEYNPIDGKWHILVQPQVGSIADIALDEPLRKYNDTFDSIEFTDGVATVTRAFDNVILNNLIWVAQLNSNTNKYRYYTHSLIGKIKHTDNSAIANLLCAIYNAVTANDAYATKEQGIGMAVSANGGMYIYDENYAGENDFEAFKAHIKDVEVIYELETPTTEIIQVPQIQEADSYTCVISQGAKAVEWSSFETD